MSTFHKRTLVTTSVVGIAVLLAVCIAEVDASRSRASDGPPNPGTPPIHQLGDADNGRRVFRFETFGNERFWTDAIRLPAGMVAAGVTPLQVLQLGLHIDINRIDSDIVELVKLELTADPTGESSPTLNDPANTVRLINANAVIGLPPKDSNGDGKIDITKGDKVGATCALCHTITDESGFSIPGKGSVGHRLDGRATHSLDFGSLVALGTNSRAFYPVLQLALAANGGATSAGRRRV